MSRTIDPESVLSQEEIDYLAARGREDVLAQNAAYLINRHVEDLVTAGDGDDQPEDQAPVTEPEPEPSVNLRSLNKPELVELAHQRGLDTEGTKEELIQRLSEEPAPTSEPA